MAQGREAWATAPMGRGTGSTPAGVVLSLAHPLPTTPCLCPRGRAAARTGEVQSNYRRGAQGSGQQGADEEEKEKTPRGDFRGDAQEDVGLRRVRLREVWRKAAGLGGP